MDKDHNIKNNLENLAQKMRYTALEMSFNCGESTHLGGGLSIIEIMAKDFKVLGEYKNSKDD